MKKTKKDVVTFKADEALVKALKGVPNRSEFIRNALLSALDNSCPLCNGTGIMTPEQREHWTSFASSHAIEECERCHAVHLICLNRAEGPAPGAHPGKERQGGRRKAKS